MIEDDLLEAWDCSYLSGSLWVPQGPEEFPEALCLSRTSVALAVTQVGGQPGQEVIQASHDYYEEFWRQLRRPPHEYIVRPSLSEPALYGLENGQGYVVCSRSHTPKLPMYGPWLPFPAFRQLVKSTLLAIVDGSLLLQARATDDNALVELEILQGEAPFVLTEKTHRWPARLAKDGSIQLKAANAEAFDLSLQLLSPRTLSAW